MKINSHRKAVALWLYLGVFMIIVEIFLGGTTRLTGSGLSITEWAPIMGAIPPTNQQEWEHAFSQYQQIAQYKYLNNHFSLDDFKFIFFWEWFHRLWARLLGIVFLSGFIFFIIRRYFEKDMVLPLILLFTLGAAQGLIGWIMVKSGLNDTNLYVSHIRLAIHFMAALILLCYTLWFALQLSVPETQRISHSGFRKHTLVVLGLLAIQLTYGAFMSGLKAAPSAPTWPMINGRWIPSAFMEKSWVSDILNVQFIHRTLAYLLVILIVHWWYKAGSIRKLTSPLRTIRWFPLLFVVVQVVLGIYTILHAHVMGARKFGSYEVLAEAHQLTAIFLLISLMVSLYYLKPAKR